MSQTTASIRYVKDREDDVFFPVTHQRGVVDDNGTNLETSLTSKQDTLVSGTSIKTINNQSILGAGNIEVQTEITMDNVPTADSDNPVKSGGIYTSLQGKQATIQSINVSVDNNTGTPSGSASMSGNSMNFSFQNLKGSTGATPILSIGTVSTLAADAQATASITGTTNAPVLNLGIPKGSTGSKGDSGYGGDQQIVVVNDVTTGGETDALSAEQGKILKGLIDDVDVQWSDISEGEKMQLDSNNVRQIILTISGDVYDSMTLYAVKSLASVVAVYDDNSRVSVSDFSLTGLVKAGAQTFTASAFGLKATATVTVLERTATLTSISAVCSEAEVSMYMELDQLRQYLTVTKVYSDTTTEVTELYDLSGTLAQGSSTITVTYTPDNTLTTTFTVTGVADGSYTSDHLYAMVDFADYEDNYTGAIVDSVSGLTMSTGSGTLENAQTKATFGGIHDGVFISARWMETTVEKLLYPTLVGATTGYPITVEVYGRLRAPYNRGVKTVGTFPTSSVNLIECYLQEAHSSYADRLRLTNEKKFNVHGPANVPNALSDVQSLDIMDSNNPNVTKYTHLVLCLNSKLQQVYLNGNLVVDGTGSTYSMESGRNIVFATGGNASAAFDYCVLRVYNKILNAREVQRNYLNCINVHGTDIIEE